MSVPAAVKGSGDPDSIMIATKKGRISQEEIDRMVKEAEEFASQYDERRKGIEALNSLSSSLFKLKNPLKDEECMSRKVSAHDPKALQEIIEEISNPINSSGSDVYTDTLQRDGGGQSEGRFEPAVIERSEEDSHEHV